MLHKRTVYARWRLSDWPPTGAAAVCLLQETFPMKQSIHDTTPVQDVLLELGGA